MKIEKYKYIGLGKYKVLISGKEYIIYEDVIIKYNILSKNYIEEQDLKLFLKDNSYYEAYYLALKQINTKMRTPKEIIKILEKKEYKQEIIKSVVKKLQEEGYLNDKSYTKAYIYDQINLKNKGPIKIKKELLQEGIDENLIDTELEIFTKSLQEDKIKKYIKTQINLNTNKSANMLKNKILMSLIEKGYYKTDIENCLEAFKFDDSKIYQKEYKKAYDKMSKKYTGTILEYKIKNYMYQKGFEVK